VADQAVPVDHRDRVVHPATTDRLDPVAARLSAQAVGRADKERLCMDQAVQADRVGLCAVACSVVLAVHRGPADHLGSEVHLVQAVTLFDKLG
jgi:hypothetical protein